MEAFCYSVKGLLGTCGVENRLAWLLPLPVISSYLKCVEVQLRGLKPSLEFGHVASEILSLDTVLQWKINSHFDYCFGWMENPPWHLKGPLVQSSCLELLFCHAIVNDLCSAYFFFFLCSRGHHAWLLLRQWRCRNIFQFVLELNICLVEWAASLAEFCVAACSCRWLQVLQQHDCKTEMTLLNSMCGILAFNGNLPQK